MDEKVGKYLDKLNDNQRLIVGTIRNTILINFPKIKESGMAEGLWYEGKFYITAFKDHVNLGVGIGGLSEEEKKKFQGSGKTMRQLKIYARSGLRPRS